MKTMLLTVVAVVAMVASAATQEKTETIAITEFPVPAWPEDGVIPEDLKDQYVFVDLPRNEYVVAYPENLDSETFEKDGPGPLKIARYELLRGVAPEVSVAITTTATPGYEYAYSINNGSEAQQALGQWGLALPVLARRDTIAGPPQWFAVIQNGRTFKLRYPEWMPNGVGAFWSFEEPEAMIPPGTTMSGFKIESGLRPGFTVAYLRSAESVESRIATLGFVPDAVASQLELLQPLEYNSRTLLTLGPKFDRHASDHSVAADYIRGIRFLSQAGRLDPNSGFVSSLLAELEKIPAAGARPELQLPAAAPTPLATEILNALRLNLNLN